MASDKSWITLRNRYDPVFIKGLDNFIEVAKKHVNSQGKFYCPCKNCSNHIRQTPSAARDHIFDYGFLQSYVNWVYHGEPYPKDSLANFFLLNNKRDACTTTTNDEMFDAIDDIMAEQDTHEPNIDGDGGEDRTGPNKEFEQLFAELNTELFPGCTWMSSLKFIAKLLHIKVLNNWTNASFTQLLGFLREAFPKQNRIPKTYYEAKTQLRTIGLGYDNIDACINDCALFWKEHESKENCPVCGESRYVQKDTNAKKVPRKRLRYFPLTPRLRRLYASRFTAKQMIWHHTGRSTDGMMRHPVDGKEWQEFDEKYPDFAIEPRNVRLGLAADGFNPYGNLSQSYSMWPVLLTTYNTPPWLCMKESSLMLTLLIPGPKSPGKDIDVYLRPLVDELKTLWADGVQIRDASTDNLFTMRAALLWTINDYPARSSLSGWSGQGYTACSTCHVDTPSMPVKSKVAFVGHRRFLPSNHKWRNSLLFNGKREKRKPPQRLTSAQVQAQLESLPDRLSGKHPSYGGQKRKRAKSDPKWTKQSIFFELDYWSTLTIKHNLDVMHVEKNVCESVLGTLLMNDKSKDTHKAREDLKEMGIREDLWEKKDDNNKPLYPQAPYSFSPDNRKRFCDFIKGVRLPDGFGSNFKNKVVGSNLIGLKSHDHHILMQRLLPVGIRAGISEEVAQTINDLSTFFKKVCARSVNVEDMYNAQAEVVKLLCNMELIYPPAFFDIMVHVILHLPEEAIMGGPVYMRWMYPFERYMKKLKQYVRNKARPEGSIAEGYVADEALTFCSMYLEGIETKFNRPDRNADPGIPKRQYQVFASQCRPMFAKKVTPLCAKSLSSLGWFVLDNCQIELESYFSEFKSSFPQGNVETEFSSWFRSKIYNSSDCTDELRALADGPMTASSYTACIVNGVRFVAHHRDTGRTTQNSGVVSFGEDGTPFYGQLEEIIELFYSHECSVVIFRCKWFNTYAKGRSEKKNNLKLIDITRDLFHNIEWYDHRQYILATQATQVFYLQDPKRPKSNWRVVEDVHHRKIWDRCAVSGIDVLHDVTSSDYNLDVNSDLPRSLIVDDEGPLEDDAEDEGPCALDREVNDDSHVHTSECSD